MSFAELFPESVENFKLNRTSPEALAALDYATELELKNQAIRKLLASLSLPHAPELHTILASPRPRNYRTTGKRMVSCLNRQIFFHFGRYPKAEKVAASQLEYAVHQQIYQLLHTLLSQPRNYGTATALHYCILRGNDAEVALIFNVRKLSGDIVRNLRFVAEAVQKQIPALRSAFLYLDETASDYYLEAERPEGKLAFKKLFGSELLALKLPTRKFLYPVTVFSQINESILPCTSELLVQQTALGKEDMLLDLYCGYGLWSLMLAESNCNVYALEWSQNAIQAARSNGAYHYPKHNLRFDCSAITREILANKLPPPRYEREVILLDPPRHGCAPGVLETLIARKSRRILHLFCGADEIAPALRIYASNNCRIKALFPMDFFPGTLNVEMLAVIEPPQA